LHGTQVRPSASVSSFQSALRPTSVRLKAYSPVQLCSGDTLQLGKSVQFGRDDFPPVEVRAHFRYPELGNGSSSGKRTFIGVTSPDFANGKFASNADVERLIAGVRATGTWRTEQNDGMKSIAPEEEADSECEHREEEIQGTQSRWERRLVNADQLNVDNQSPTASNGGKSDDDEHTPRGGPERDDSPPFDLDALPPVRESTMRPSGYRVPPSVLYQSDDEESELPRGSENRQDAEDEEDQETDGEGPERLRLRPRPPINIAEPLVQLARRNDSTECRLAHRNLVPTADGTGAIYRLVPHTRGGSASDLWADPFDAIFDDEADLEPVQWSHQLPLSPGPKESSSKGHEEGDKNEVADPIHPPIAFYGANLERTEYNEDNEPHRDPAYGRWYSYTSEPDEEAIAFEGQIPLDPAHANDRDGEQDEDRIKSEETCHGQDGLPSLPPIWAPLLSEARTEDYEVKEEDVQDVADEGRTAVNTDKHVTFVS